MKKIVISVIAILLVLLVIFLGVSYFTNNKKESETIRYIGIKVYDPVYIAKDKGFFEKYNVDVEIVDLVTGGPNALQMISGGSAEVGISSYMAIINARASDMPVEGIADIQSAIGDQALEEFFVRKDSGIGSIEDLKGKKIAINLVKSSFHYTWLMALEEAGLKETDVEFVVLPFDQQELALDNNQVDAIGLMQPYVEHAKENGDFEVLYTALDVFGAKQFCTYAINSEWAANNPELATAFVSAIIDASIWIEDNQEEAKQIISKYTGVETKYIEDYKFQENLAVIMEDAQYWLDYMKSRGDLEADWLTVDDFATNKYNSYKNQ